MGDNEQTLPDSLTHIARDSIALLKKYEAEIAAMRPVVDAAVKWRKAGDKRNTLGVRANGREVDDWMRSVDMLSAAVDKYRDAAS